MSAGTGRRGRGHDLLTATGRQAFNRQLAAAGMDAKICRKCVRVKALAEFPTLRNTYDGLRSVCWSCGPTQ